ncbi:acidic leucine-rich nuclear phosphoprotein 32 family member B isoform X3 [Bacillus rossius redtenbacheri]|uniref:acidic leucine-rich nuclear phosphoprotein 32 family member B isoform X3 n=1 Tax=Bacillus rossius redtenbacheri TaxID=93214 RepID=UPI002FDE1CB7
MARLTEEMVIARSRASDLSNIKKLNCWGSDLQDVSLLRRMHNVEVLSLSVNKINNLSDFQFCRNLQELYVRKNEIRDLNQICYLQELPRLRNLWLDENPCANAENYRLTVLRALPHLQKLDNSVVKPEEVQDACRKGLELLHPEDMSPDSQWPSALSSPDCSPAQDQEYEQRMESSYYPDSYYEYEETERVARPQPVQRTPPQRRRVSGDRDGEAEQVPRKPSTPADDQGFYDTDRRNANYEPDTPMSSRKNSNHFISSENISPSSEELQRMRSNSSYHLNQDPRDSGSEGSEYNGRGKWAEDDVRSQQYDRNLKSHQQMDTVSQRMSSNGHPLYPRRPTTKSSNILSAVLCLIKELDYPSLEVVEVAVRSRIEEF